MAFNELFTFSTTATVDDTYTSPFYVVVGWYDVAGDTTDLDTVLTTNDNTADNANNLTYWRVRVADDSGTYDANTPSTYQEYGAGDGALDDVTDSGNTVADLSSYEENYDGVTPGYKLSFRWQDEFPYFYIDYRDAGTDVKGCVTTIAEPPTLTHETSAGANDGTVTFAIAESPGSTTGYEFSLDQNTWQSSPTFSSLAPGIYNGYARKTNNTSCNDNTTFEILASTADISANFGVKWRLEFQSYRDETIRVDIEEQNYSGYIDDTIQATARPCIFEYGVQNGNIYDVIRGSRVTIGLISESNQEFTSIGQSNFQKYRVSIYIDTALEWRGFVLPEEYREPYVRNAYRISLVATDGLAYLANYDFAGGTTPQGGNRILGLRKQLDIIRICLNKLDLDLNVRTCVNLYEITDAPVTETNDPFNDYYVRADGYYNTSDEDGVNRTAQGAVDPGEALSCLEVLQRILQPYGAYIVQTEGSWQILQADEKRATFTRRLYNASGVYQTFDEYDPEYTLNDAATYETGDATADAHYINAGATLEIIPARGYQKINRVYGLADSILIGGRFGYSDFTDSSTLKSWSAVNVTVSRKPVSRQDFSYALAIAGGASTTAGYVQSQDIPINGSISDRLLIRFSYYMNAFTGGTSEDPKVRLQIQYGSYYLTPAGGDAFPGWSTDVTKFVDNSVPVDQYRKWQNYEVTTQGLPATGPNNLTVRIYQGINPTSGIVAQDVIEEIQIQDFEIIYLPDGDFGTEEDYIEEFNNTYVTRGDEITLYHLDAPDDVGNAKNIYLNAFYRDSSGTATNAWYRKGYAEEVPISELLLRRIMNNYATPLQRISGMEIRATGAMPRPHYRVTDPQQSSKKFVIPYMLGDIRTGDYTIELHEIAAEDAVVPSVDGYGYERETDREFNILLETGFVLLLEDQTDATYTPPGLITDLTATGGYGSIDLSWTGSYKVKVYRRTSSFTDVADATLINTKNTASQTYTDSTAVAGTTYYYRIVPFNDAGDGPASNIDSAALIGADWNILGDIEARTAWNAAGFQLDDSSGEGNNIQLATGYACEFVAANSDYTTAINLGNIKSIEFWIKLDSTTENIIDLDGGTSYIDVGSGTLNLQNGTSESYYVNGAAGSIIGTDWTHVVIAQSTNIAASAMEIGRIGATYGDFQIKDLKFYSTELSSAQALEAYNNPQQDKPTGATLVASYFYQNNYTNTVADVTVFDNSGNNNHLALTTSASHPYDAVIVNVVFGKQIALSEFNSYDLFQLRVAGAIVLDNPITFSNTGFTIQFSVFTPNNINSDQRIFQLSASNQIFYKSNALQFWLTDGTSPAGFSVSISSKTKYNIVCTARINAGNIERDIYIDGVLAGSAPLRAITETDWSFLTGIISFSGNPQLSGLLWDINIYDEYTSDGTTGGLNQIHGYSGINGDWSDNVGSNNGTSTVPDKLTVGENISSPGNDILSNAIAFEYFAKRLNFSDPATGANKTTAVNIGNVRTLCFLFRTTNKYTDVTIAETGTGNTIALSSGAIAAADFDTIKVDVSTNSIAANDTWYFVSMTSTTDVNLSAFAIDQNFTNGYIVNLRAYAGELSDSNLQSVETEMRAYLP